MLNEPASLLTRLFLLLLLLLPSVVVERPSPRRQIDIRTCSEARTITESVLIERVIAKRRVFPSFHASQTFIIETPFIRDFMITSTSTSTTTTTTSTRITSTSATTIAAAAATTTTIAVAAAAVAAAVQRS